METTRGQVCDRCRLKKIRCHGPANPCTPCSAIDSICTVSARLKRRRKRSSFHDTASNESPTSANTALPLFLSPPEDVVASASPPQPRTRPDPVIGHMGRLVSNQQNVAMFGGSSTGVHFLNQADQQLHAIYNQPGAFPNAVYSLHLRNIWQLGPRNTSFMYAIITQLPFDTEQAIERVIDHWTPLYPIIHKATTIETYRRISRNPQAADDVCTVYQILLLLALDRFGKSPMDGSNTSASNNPIEACEPFYDLSTQILNEVLERPRLLAIQGLQLTQLYFQLSSRHSLASHLGATSTRMAQGIGLHRHSHRFKFSALETELRRRAWWCQYALDTFSSAYHGMPRLIRDQDVDTDMPTPADFEHSNHESAQFPLPGERSPIDSAISFFKLATIMGDTLESLYSTTRRRGGVAKIAKLQSDLDTWRRNLPPPSSSSFSSLPKSASSEIGNRGDNHHTVHGGSSGSGEEENSSFHRKFLYIAHCVVTVHIHRPALTFTTPHEQYTTSVRECLRAATSLIELVSSSSSSSSSSQDLSAAPPRILDYDDDIRMVTLLYPNGLHMLWQAGLTLLFARWSGCTDHAPRRDQMLLDSCINSLLRVAGQDPLVRECVGVLERLREKTFVVVVAPAQEQQQEQQPPRATAGLESEHHHVREQEGVWNIWEWPMTSALDLENSFDAIPVYLNLDGSVG